MFKHPKIHMALLAGLPLLLCTGWVVAVGQGDVPGMVRCAACRFKAAVMPGAGQPSC